MIFGVVKTLWKLSISRGCELTFWTRPLIRVICTTYPLKRLVNRCIIILLRYLLQPQTSWKRSATKMRQRVRSSRSPKRRLHSAGHDDQLLLATVAPQKRAAWAFGQISFVRCQILLRYVRRPIMHTMELGIVKIFKHSL